MLNEDTYEENYVQGQEDRRRNFATLKQEKERIRSAFEADIEMLVGKVNETPSATVNVSEKVNKVT